MPSRHIKSNSRSGTNMPYHQLRRSSISLYTETRPAGRDRASTIASTYSGRSTATTFVDNQRPVIPSSPSEFDLQKPSLTHGEPYQPQQHQQQQQQRAGSPQGQGRRRSDASYTSRPLSTMDGRHQSLSAQSFIAAPKNIHDKFDPSVMIHTRPVASQMSSADNITPLHLPTNRSMSFLIEGGQDPEAGLYAYNEKGIPMTPPTPMTPTHPIMLHDPPKIPLLREIAFIGVVAVSHLMTQAAMGQALAPLSTIGATFGTSSLADMTWYIAAHSLTVGTFILVSGRIGDILGHKRVFVFGYCWLGMWAAFCGFAAYTHKQVFFDFCRAMQGIGPALLMPNGLALFGRAYPVGIKKNIVFSIFGAVAPMGFVLGALSGSIFAEYLWWPWTFWTYAIASFLLGTFALLVIPYEVGCQLPNRPTFDWQGAISGIAGLVLINVAWNEAPISGWKSPHVYFMLIIGLMFIAFFFHIERKVKDPLLPMAVLDGATGFVLTCVGTGWGSFGVWLFYTSRFIMEQRGHSALIFTAQFSPAVITGILAAGLTGFMLTHTPVSFTMMVSMCAFFIGQLIGGFAPLNQSYWAMTFVSIFIMPFGMDMSFPAATVILSNSMPREHQGLAASLVNTFVNYFIATALGIAGTVEAYSTPDQSTKELQLKGIRSGFYTSMGLSGIAVVVGMVYFIKTYRKEGWKIMAH